MKYLWIFAATAVFLTGCSKSGTEPASQATSPESASLTMVADAVYTNGKIYTVDPTRPWAKAVALKDGAFVAVGTNADVKAMIGSETTVIDLGGKFVMPGFHDIHVHVEQAYIADMLGDAMMNFPPEETSVEALQGLLKMHSDKNPDLPILFAGGLEISLFPNSSQQRHSLMT